MDFIEFESDWKKIKIAKKDKTRLKVMTQIKNHPKIRRMRLKFIIEAFSLVVFIILYYDGFDGHMKSFWVNFLLVSSSFGYILTRVFGWHTLRNPIKADNLKQSMESLQGRLKRIAALHLISAVSFAIGLIVFFSSVIVFTPKKYGILIGMVITFSMLLLISSRNWIRQIKDVHSTLEAFQEVSQ